MTSSVPALDIRGVSKTFGATTVLRDFTLQVQPGEVHVLVGENGSGKSTLIKVLSGYHPPDPGGVVLVDGQPLEFGSSDRSHRSGCRFVHQDLGLVGDMTVLDNLSLGAGYPTRLATIRTRSATREAREQLARVGSEVEPTSMLRDLRAAERTGVAIARAVRPDEVNPARILVLDEPTASLPADEVDRLLATVRRATEAGLAVLFVTHHLDEVFRVADRVTVLRDGRIVGTSDIGDVTRAQLVQQLVGEGWEESPPALTGAVDARSAALTVQHLSDTVLDGVSFSVAPGEILGIAGLTGSGRDSLLGAVFGATMRTEGTVWIRGRELPPGRPDLAVRRGLAYLPPDRKTHSGLMSLSCRENLTLADLSPVSSRGWLRRRSEHAEVRDWFTRLDVRPGHASELPLASLSGGNQQKVLLAKWMRLSPAVFLLDEPTQGVDIGAKAEVHRNLVALAAQGMAVVVASTDSEELPALCHRVLITRGGRIASSLAGADLTFTNLKNAILGEQTPTESDHAS